MLRYNGIIACSVHVEETPLFWTKPHSVGFSGKIHIVNPSSTPGKGINLLAVNGCVSRSHEVYPMGSFSSFNNEIWIQ